jgi:hypothetical protein
VYTAGYPDEQVTNRKQLPFIASTDIGTKGILKNKSLHFSINNLRLKTEVCPWIGPETRDKQYHGKEKS